MPTFLNKDAVLFDQSLLSDEDVYTSILDVPPDFQDYEEFRATYPDGDDSLLAHVTNDATTDVVKSRGIPDTIAGPPLSLKPTRLTRVVPLPRQLKRKMKGLDVLAVQRAISKAGYRKWGSMFTGQFGEGLEMQLRRFQKDHHLHIDGQYGPETHNAMKKYYDGYGARLMLREQALLAKQNDPRKLIVIGATWGYNHRWLIHYTQGGSRMYGVRYRIHIPGIPYYEDCSSFATWCYYQAGLPDPNHLGYSGYGFTGTLGSHGVNVSVAKPGDLCFYGWRPWHHVSVAVSSYMCVSHGSEIGPLLVPIRYRGDLNTIHSYIM